MLDHCDSLNTVHCVPMIQGSKDNLPPPNLVLGERRYLGKGSFVDAQVPNRGRYFEVLLECLQKTETTNEFGENVELEEALKRLAAWAAEAHVEGNKVVFIGNGGSSAIASHMAVDWSKNGGVRSLAFNDAAMLTCLSNDYGYQNVFAKQLEYHGRKGDVAVIVSTSGRSLNILASVDAARQVGCRAIVTLSGMNPNNTLRQRGTLNFYVPCIEYGLVELSHISLLHSIVSVPG